MKERSLEVDMLNVSMIGSSILTQKTQSRIGRRGTVS